MDDLAVKAIIAATVLLLAAGIVEKVFHRRALRAVPVRILVNGTRGKTSVTRLIAAILREAGVRTWAKATGTQAVYILPDGTEREYRKRRPVNIREQVPFFRSAARDGAQAAVVECMALHPENQRMMGEELVRPTIVVLTNARVDHVGEIGRTGAETAEILALCVPRGAQVVADDAAFTPSCRRPSPRWKRTCPRATSRPFPTPPLPKTCGRRCAWRACWASPATSPCAACARRGRMWAMCGPFHVGQCTVINAFAANEPQSSQELMEATLRTEGLEDAPLWLLFNSRADRGFRLPAFAPLVRQLAAQGAHLRVIGENTARVARYFARHAGIDAQPLREAPLAWLESLGAQRCAVLCLGNIRGAGLEMIEILLQEDAHQARKEGTSCCNKPSA